MLHDPVGVEHLIGREMGDVEFTPANGLGLCHLQEREMSWDNEQGG